MEVVFFYKDQADKKSLVSRIGNQDWAEDVEVSDSQSRVIVSVASGMEDEADSFSIKERYRGRKVIIDA
jgi:hypothetical protein